MPYYQTAHQIELYFNSNFNALLSKVTEKAFNWFKHASLFVRACKFADFLIKVTCYKNAILKLAFLLKD